MLHETKKILDSAIASVEMEGYKLTEEDKKLCYDYVNDTITKNQIHQNSSRKMCCIMSYSLEPLQDDCYEGTTVLINKFGIKDDAKLDMVERDITSALIAKAYIEIPFEDVDFDFYKNLHYYVFSDIYEWAGKIRNVDMSKKGTRFCPPEKIETSGRAIFEYLSKKSYFTALAD